jgi:ABC-type glycerol-3-phosphate transport system substrate-binding protein
MMKTTARLLLYLLPLAACPLAGCFAESKASDGRVHVSYWEKWTGFEADAMRDTVDAFNRSQNRVFVDFLTVSQVDRKMLLATAGGNPPDVAGLWSFNTHVYADKNAIIPLDGFMQEAGIQQSDYLPSYWDLSFYRGKTWALPTTPASVALHWNKDHFREAGLDPERPPRTIEELDAYAEKLTRRDANGKIIRMGFSPNEPGWWNWGWGYFFGGRLWDGKDQITANAPENLRAFRWIQSYAKKYDVRDLQVFQSGFGNFSSPQNAFLAGKVSMELQGVWMYNFIDKYAPDLKWAAAPFPHPADRPDLAHSTPVDIDTLVIPNGARHPREAFEFIQFVQSHKGMELLCLGQRKHTPLASDSRTFYAQHPHPFLKVFIDLAKSPNTFAPPKIGVWREYQDELTNAFSNVWLCKKTPEEALNEVQQRMQKKLDKELRKKRRTKRET